MAVNLVILLRADAAPTTIRSQREAGRGKLVELMRKKDLDPRAVIAAVNSLLDRGIGKPMQPMQQQYLGADGQPISPDFIVNVSQYAEPPPAPEGSSSR
jgi:hypothetical protein